MNHEHQIHQNARVVAEMPGDDCPVLVVQIVDDDEWGDVDEVQLAPGVDVDRFSRHLAGAYRKVVAAAPGNTDPKASPRSKLADAAVDLRRATLAVKAAECQSPDPDYGPCSSCAACVEKARARGEKSSALSRLRYWADKVIDEARSGR